MNKRYGWLILLVLLLVAGVGLWLPGLGGARPPQDYVLVSRSVKISPDYTGTIIPPNIAPLNFLILEPGKKYIVKIHSANGGAVNVSSSSGKIKIPLRRWKSLLNANRGKELFFDIYVEDEFGRWSRYDTITNTIAKENIDSYLTYRLITPIHNYYSYTAIFQRNLEYYDESLLLDSRYLGAVCVNCHSFANNSPESMLVGIRSEEHGSSALFVRNGKVRKIGSKFGYTAWHPSGRLAAYSLNKVRQFFHTSGIQTRDVVDLDSAIAYYEVDSQTVKTNPNLTDPNRLESYPTWTPDGKYLYFCSAPILWEDRNYVPPENCEKVKYDLMRISYDVQTDQWGKLEVVLPAAETGLSVMLPRVSPDGRFLLFCMCDYGCFPVYQPSSDLYMMDLRTGEYGKLPVNSDYSESWHSWSSNGRWMAFSSKRGGSLFTRLYFSYIDENGKVYKPIVMPQKDPTFYDTLILTYSVPELITGPVKVRYADLLRGVRSTDKIEVDVPITMATPAGVVSPPAWQAVRE
jgi:hypothetical protein